MGVREGLGSFWEDLCFLKPVASDDEVSPAFQDRDRGRFSRGVVDEVQAFPGIVGLIER